MGDVLFTSFATPRYYEEMVRLQDSLQRFKLSYELTRIGHDFGSWEQAQSYKPAHILCKMMEHPTKRIVWLDADAEVRKVPTLLLEHLHADFAIFWRGDVSASRMPHMTGTLLMNNKFSTVQFMCAWVEASAADRELWDQATIKTLIDRMKPTVQRLPTEYCMKFDDTHATEKAVIMHHQASRRLKKR